MNVWPSRWASMLPRIGHFFPNKGHKDWGKRGKFNNACLGDWARCYLLAAIRPAVDQWRLKQQVSISPDESLACQGGGRIFCQDEHLLHCLLNSLWLQQRRKHHKSSFQSSRDAAAVNRAPFEPRYEHGGATRWLLQSEQCNCGADNRVTICVHPAILTRLNPLWNSWQSKGQPTYGDQSFMVSRHWRCSGGADWLTGADEAGGKCNLEI